MEQLFLRRKTRRLLGFTKHTTFYSHVCHKTNVLLLQGSDPLSFKRVTQTPPAAPPPVRGVVRSGWGLAVAEQGQTEPSRAEAGCVWMEDPPALDYCFSFERRIFFYLSGSSCCQHLSSAHLMFGARRT